MGVIDEFNAWLQASSLYNDYLAKMPVPLNNIYFDTFLILAIAVYVIYRVTVFLRCSHTNSRMQQKHNEAVEEEILSSTEESIRKTNWW